VVGVYRKVGLRNILSAWQSYELGVVDLLKVLADFIRLIQGLLRPIKGHLILKEVWLLLHGLSKLVSQALPLLLPNCRLRLRLGVDLVWIIKILRSRWLRLNSISEDS